MTATLTQRVHNYSYSRIGVLDFTGDASYPTGGYPVTAANFGLTDVVAVVVQAGPSGLLFEYDYANQKLVIRYPTGSSLASPAAIGDPIINAGGTTVTGSAATGPIAAGRGKELANATNCAAVTARLVAWGS